MFLFFIDVPISLSMYFKEILLGQIVVSFQHNIFL